MLKYYLKDTEKKSTFIKGFTLNHFHLGGELLDLIHCHFPFLYLPFLTWDYVAHCIGGFAAGCGAAWKSNHCVYREFKFGKSIMTVILQSRWFLVKKKTAEYSNTFLNIDSQLMWLELSCFSCVLSLVLGSTEPLRRQDSLSSLRSQTKIPQMAKPFPDCLVYAHQPQITPYSIFVTVLTEKFLHPNKSLCQCDSSNQTKSNRIR